MVPGTFCGPLTAKFIMQWEGRPLTRQIWQRISQPIVGGAIESLHRLNPKWAPVFFVVECEMNFFEGKPRRCSPFPKAVDPVLGHFVSRIRFHLELHTAYPSFLSQDLL